VPRPRGLGTGNKVSAPLFFFPPGNFITKTRRVFVKTFDGRRTRETSFPKLLRRKSECHCFWEKGTLFVEKGAFEEDTN